MFCFQSISCPLSQYLSFVTAFVICLLSEYLSFIGILSLICLCPLSAKFSCVKTYMSFVKIPVLCHDACPVSFDNGELKLYVNMAIH